MATGTASLGISPNLPAIILASYLPRHETVANITGVDIAPPDLTRRVDACREGSLPGTPTGPRRIEGRRITLVVPHKIVDNKAGICIEPRNLVQWCLLRI